MDDIITQRFSYATITPFKDYCKLNERSKLINSFVNWTDSKIDTPFGLTRINNYQKNTGEITQLPEKGRKNKRKLFFYESNDSVQERFLIDYVYNGPNGIHQFDTTKDHQIKRHFGRAFSSITTHVIERSVRRHGDKVTIKLYTSRKSRGYNCIYFKKSFTVDSITINLKTGNFTTAHISKTGGKMSSKQFRTNSFISVERVVSYGSFFVLRNLISSSSRLHSEFESIFDNIEFTTKILEVLGIEMGCVSYALSPIKFVNDLCDFFVRTKKIKVPNGDYRYWLTKYYPTEKYLKKNDRKLVASILDMFEIKSKYTIKILHEYPNIDLYGLINFCRYFGNDYSKYIANLDSKSFENSFRKDKPNEMWGGINKEFIINNRRHFLNQISDTEKENLIKIANSTNYTGEGIFSERMIQLIDDHFKMIDKIRDYDPDVSMKARTMEEFNNEHREFSKVISAIKKGWVIEYRFADKMVEDVEKPIPLKINLGTEEEPQYATDIDISFYPYILKREEEYMEEGSFMHHCVATYSDKDRSIIISVRTMDSSDRVTCEYDCQSGKLIQARHFCNKQPPADIEMAIEELSKKVEKYARMGILHCIEKKKVPVKINGVEVQKTEPTNFLDTLRQDMGLPLQF